MDTTQETGSTLVRPFENLFPTYYPNRRVRRAVQLKRESRLPPEWRSFLALNPRVKEAIRRLRSTRNTAATVHALVGALK